jgi:hypothetical protein
MKIDPTDKQLRVISPNTVQHKTGTNDQQDFAKVLGESVQRASQAQVQKGQSMPPVSGPDMRIQREPVIPEVKTAHGLLNALEDYQKQLNNPEASLRMVEPLVKRMSSLFEETRPVLEKMPEEHPVKSVVQETLVHMSKEIERFKMGYYVGE